MEKTYAVNEGDELTIPCGHKVRLPTGPDVSARDVVAAVNAAPCGCGTRAVYAEADGKIHLFAPPPPDRPHLRTAPWEAAAMKAAYERLPSNRRNRRAQAKLEARRIRDSIMQARARAR